MNQFILLVLLRHLVLKLDCINNTAYCILELLEVNIYCVCEFHVSNNECQMKTTQVKPIIDLAANKH